MMKEFMGRLDEVLGAGLLASIAIYGMATGATDIAQGCVAGIVALLAVGATKK